METPIQIAVTATQGTGRVIWCDVVIPIPTVKTRLFGHNVAIHDRTVVEETTPTCCVSDAMGMFVLTLGSSVG